MNSILKQKICRDFVHENVFCCVSDIMGDLIDSDKVDYFSLISEYKSNQQKLKQEQDDDYDPNEDTEFDEVDVYEWWAVDAWFAKMLNQHGEIVCEEYLTPIWGRQCTGQAILLDGVIEEICADLGMFENEVN